MRSSSRTGGGDTIIITIKWHLHCCVDHVIDELMGFFSSLNGLILGGNIGQYKEARSSLAY